MTVIHNAITSFNLEIYIDEDEYWDLESIASGNRYNFSGVLTIHCVNPHWLLSESAYQLLSENLSKRVSSSTLRVSFKKTLPLLYMCMFLNV